jgi:hypothetical protein
MRTSDVQLLLDQRIAALAAAHYGVVTHAQLRALGASPDQIKRRRKTGLLIAL